MSNQVGAMWGFMGWPDPLYPRRPLRAIAVGSKERSPVLPDVPTVAEGGVPGLEAVLWIGMVAPAGTPGPVVAKLRSQRQRRNARATVRNFSSKLAPRWS